MIPLDLDAMVAAAHRLLAAHGLTVDGAGDNDRIISPAITSARDVLTLAAALRAAEARAVAAEAERDEAVAALAAERDALAARHADLRADYETGADEVRRLYDARAAEVAAAVDAEVRRERDMWQAQIETTTTDAADALDMIDDLVRHAVLHHPLPWRIEDDWTREVTAKDGTIIAKCMTHDQAAAIIAAAEKIRADLDAPICVTCGLPATCRGEYEGEEEYACDQCCGHGNEDGHCEPVGDVAADAGVR